MPPHMRNTLSAIKGVAFWRLTLPLWPYSTIVCWSTDPERYSPEASTSASVAVSSNRMPAQSLCAGDALFEVNRIGASRVPRAIRLPLTTMPRPGLNLMTVPGWIVNVAPLATMTLSAT